MRLVTPQLSAPSDAALVVWGSDPGHHQDGARVRILAEQCSLDLALRKKVQHRKDGALRYATCDTDSTEGQ